MTPTFADVLHKLINSSDNEHEPLTNFINGSFVGSDYLIGSDRPATGKQWIQIPNATKEEVDSAVDAAHKAFQLWKKTSVGFRAKLLNKLADLIEAHLEQFAILESRDQGKPVALARTVDIPRCIHNFRYFASAMQHHVSPSTILEEPTRALNYVKYDPIGVAGLISPWNLPLYLLSFKMAPALITGNTIVCKPSELTSVTAWAMMHAVVQAGFPPGVVNLVIGKGDVAGNTLVTHPLTPLISFTGSTLIGKRIGELGAKLNKKVSLEMGGKNAAVIYASANLDRDLPLITRSCFLNQGEICLCTSRIFVQRSIAEDFLSRLVEQAQKLTVGDPNKQFDLGAMNSKVHFDKVCRYIASAKKGGGTVHCGGVVKLEGPHSEGFFIAPTVISGLADDSDCMTEEIFGPVVCVAVFDEMEEVVERVNESEYGLSATVWSTHSEELMNTANSLRVGTVWCNTWMVREKQT
ncbi:unnamed protein product [Caenorhabditis auriculariae]|uniref:Aldehyde dehydrogenase domain-containing protein n=1 Tax=Caenorhabditis auriculariae TaxID=2777116 RepID=A0A8S1H3P1_9PELO|nr:unnamed protein product [Caenorhabditis auriculariae]